MKSREQLMVYCTDTENLIAVFILSTPDTIDYEWIGATACQLAEIHSVKNWDYCVTEVDSHLL